MTVNFYPDRTSKKEERTIFAIIRGTSCDKTFIYHTGEKISFQNWDKIKQRAKTRYIGSPQLNQKLALLKEKLLLTYRNMEIETLTNKDFALTPDIIALEFDKIFGKVKSKSLSLFEALDVFIDVKSDMSKASQQKFKALRSQLKEFEKTCNYKVNFASMDMMFFDLYINFLRTHKEHVDNTISNQLGILKVFMNWATDRGSNHKLDYRRFKMKETPTDTIRLTDEELLALYNFDLSNNPRLAAVRDTFCFACYTGARFSDISGLQWNDINKHTWNLRTVKTKDLLAIPLSGYALAILEKQKGEVRPLKVISNQKMNSYLKELCKDIGLNEKTKDVGFNTEVKRVRYRGRERVEETFFKYQLIGTHTARRTFATLSIEKGMPIETVMEITGHKNYKTFKKYVKITDTVKQTQINKAWKSPKLRIVKAK
jgi:integrase